MVAVSTGCDVSKCSMAASSRSRSERWPRLVAALEHGFDVAAHVLEQLARFRIDALRARQLGVQLAEAALELGGLRAHVAKPRLARPSSARRNKRVISQRIGAPSPGTLEPKRQRQISRVPAPSGSSSTSPR